MKKSLHIALFCTFALAIPQMFSSCTDRTDAEQPAETGEVIAFSTAACDASQFDTKAALANHHALDENTKVRIQMSGLWVGHSPSSIVKTTTCTAQKDSDYDNINNLSFSSSEKIYWDEFGVGDVGNKEGRDAGLTIYAAAANSSTTAPTISNWYQVLWEVDASGTEVKKHDFVYANNLTADRDGTYKFDERTVAGKNRLDMKHALSQITINLTAGEGFPTSGGIGKTAHRFETDPVFTITSNKNGDVIPEFCMTKGFINVVDGVVNPESATVKKVIAQTIKSTDPNITVIKQALVFPGTVLGRLNSSDLVAKVVADGNTYLVTAAKIRAAMEAADPSTDYTTKPGYNYVFNLVVSKTQVQVTASIQDWQTIESDEEQMKVLFEADVETVTGVSGTPVTADSASFSLYMSTDTSSIRSVTPVTATYTTTTSKWSTSPVLYWPNGIDNQYFRALAEASATKTIIASTDTTIQQEGKDILWGTTAQHKGKEADSTEHDYAESAQINPRTGVVPMIFKHASSLLTVNLSTSTDAEKAVDLTGAKVTITNMYNQGTLVLKNGGISVTGTRPAKPIENYAPKSHPSTGVKTLDEYMVVPQLIQDDTKIIITLADGTTYSLQLNQCKIEGTSTKIAKWEIGNKYIYNLYLEKSAINISAVIKNWETKTGEGTADLDWD